MPSSSQREESLRVTVEGELFRSADGRFVVIRASHPQHTESITAVGQLGSLAPGETLQLRGHWQEHPRYGARFRVMSFSPVMPQTRDGIAKYLGSGLISGIGEGLAGRLVAKFGDRTLDIIISQSARLLEVEGIGRQRAEKIAEAVRSRKAEASTLSFLRGLGLGPKLARRVLDKYGADAVRLVRDDPYLVAEQVAGIGFRTADTIGREAGIPLDDPRRAAGAVLHLLGRGADEGHVFLSVTELEAGARELSVPAERVEEAIAGLCPAGLAIRDGKSIYAPPLFHAEVGVADKLRRLAQPRSQPRDWERVERQLASMFRPSATATADRSGQGRLSSMQWSAVETSVRHGLIVLTGGPGTGKTTAVRAIVEAHRALGHRVCLCAPTGRAAKRLSEATGHEASTIHRALEWSPARGGFLRNTECPLDYELVLVDEASMLDINLAFSLLDAIPEGTRVVLVGDVDQLPPVSPGHVLRELIESGIAPVVRLREIFRQAEQSQIVRGAHAILHGKRPAATPAGTKGQGDLFVIPASDPEIIQRRLIATVRRMKESYRIDPRLDLQVLVPMRKGPVGTNELNRILQRELNPSARPGQHVFSPGDKVMQLRNNYDKNVFNGDMGIVRAVDGGATFVEINGNEIQYAADDLDQLTLAYATTIHKVQGSEFPAIVIALYGGHHVLLSRALLYTAVTRAKRLAVLLGDHVAFGRAVRNAATYRTNSRLAERLTS